MARQSSRRQLSAALLVLLAAAATARAQVQFPDFSGGLGDLRIAQNDPVTVVAEFTPATDDRPALLFVTAKIEPGYHISALDQGADSSGGGPLPTTIEIDDASGVRLIGEFQAIEAPHVRIDKEAWPGLEVREHFEMANWVAAIELPAGADPASLTIKGSVEGQACDAGSCVPMEVEFTAIRGEGVPLPPGAFADGATDLAAAPAAPAESDEIVSASTPLWQVAVYGILGGLILNLMPCVLPVIGLKVLSFAKQGGQSRSHIFGLNLAYVAGLMAVFLVLATLAALVQLGISSESYGWGELYTFTWFKVAMTALVFAMALSFLGVWEIPIPGFASSGTATQLAAQEGFGGAFCMGIFTTLLATPCAGPFLGPLFGYTISQPPLITYFVFGAVGLGMALPYLLIGAFPALVSWLPKPGAWMDTLKQLLGFVLLATVVYLFSTISADYFLPTLALVFSIWFACWILGRTPAWAERSVRVNAWAKALAVAAVLGGGTFMALAPSQSPLPWQPYSPAALAAARAEGKTVLVDFTANWCLTCKMNLKFAINRAGVRKLIEQNGVVPLLADWTDRNDTIKQALAELNSRSIPLMAIYPADPNAEVIVLPDVLTQGTVLDALEKAGPSKNAGMAARESQTASRAVAASER
jgi:thiol:disulfide interchange protein